MSNPHHAAAAAMARHSRAAPSPAPRARRRRRWPSRPRPSAPPVSGCGAPRRGLAAEREQQRRDDDRRAEIPGTSVSPAGAGPGSTPAYSPNPPTTSTTCRSVEDHHERGHARSTSGAASPTRSAHAVRAMPPAPPAARAASRRRRRSRSDALAAQPRRRARPNADAAEEHDVAGVRPSSHGRRGDSHRDPRAHPPPGLVQAGDLRQQQVQRDGGTGEEGRAYQQPPAADAGLRPASAPPGAALIRR